MKSKKPIDDNKNRNLHILNTASAHNIYKKRLTRPQWIKLNLIYMAIIFVILSIVFYFGSTMLSNLLISQLVDAHSSTNTLQYTDWVLGNYNDWHNYVILNIHSGISIGIFFAFLILSFLVTLLLRYKFLILWLKKSNWVLDERYGSAHFITDERTPWTTQNKLLNTYFKKTYFLEHGNWILRIQKENDLHEFLNQASNFMTFNDPLGEDLKIIIPLLKNPVGFYSEPVKYTSANDIITDLFNKTKFHVKQSKNEFISMTTNLIKSFKVLPFSIQQSGDSPNAYVIGSTGSGKTTKLNYPTIIANANAIHQPSMIITDPKGELYGKLSGYLSARGYKTYSLDLFELIRSMGWNPLQDTYHKFMSRSIINMFLKQYDEWLRYHHSKWDEDQQKVIITDPIQNEEIGKEYPPLTNEEYDFLKQRMTSLNINQHHFLFDDRFITNPYYQENHSLIPKVITADDPLMSQYVCSVHTRNKANECHTCYKKSEDQIYVLFDGIIFMNIEAIKLHYSTTLPTQIMEQIAMISNVLFSSDGDKDSHWVESAKKVFNGAIYCYGYKIEEDVNQLLLTRFNIFSITSLINDETFFSGSFFNYINVLEKEIEKQKIKLEKNDPSVSSYSVMLLQHRWMALKAHQDYVNLNTTLNTNENELKSIRSVLSTKLAPFTTDGVKLLTSFADIKLTDLVDTSIPRVIFLGINVNDKTYHPFVSLFISSLHQKLSITAKNTPANELNNHQAGHLNRIYMFLLDEFANIPPLVNYGRILSTCRSEGIMFMNIVQSNAQLTKNYKDDKDIILTNCTMNVFIKTDEYDTAKYYSNVLGETLIQTQDYSDDEKSWFFSKKRFDFKSRSLLTAEELYKIDCSYHNDTVIITKMKQGGSIPMLIKTYPWFKVFKTKDFESYKPIQYNVNKYSINDNQVNYKKLFSNSPIKILENLTNVIPQIDESLTESIESINEQLLLADINNEIIVNEITNKLNDQQHQSLIDQNVIYNYVDVLINTYDLKFDQEKGIDINSFINQLYTYDQLVSKQLLLQFWNLLGMYTFNFSKNEFSDIIKQFLYQQEQTQLISQEEINNYIYKFNDINVNEYLIIVAKGLLTNQLDLNDLIKKYPRIKDVLVKLETYLKYIFMYELTDYIDSVIDNDLVDLYNFLTRYKNQDNNDLTYFNRFIKSLTNTVDKTIYDLYQTFINQQQFMIENQFIKKITNENWFNNHYQKYKNDNLPILFINFWNDQIIKLFINHAEILNKLFS